jgi:uncharacterized protein (DUF305 family)
MKAHLKLIVAAAFLILPGAALAQADEHHPDADAPIAAPTTPAPMAGGLPEQCMAMMPMMQQMMPMMQQMMQTMMQGGMMQGMPMGGAGMSDASQAYMNAMKMMDGPMMQAAQAADPDIAFVRAMIPHHQGAIAMARVVLEYGKDDRVKEWANQIIAAQEAEIAAMQDWLKQHGQ